MLSISQKLSQQQKLSPQQIQYQKLLQLNTLALEQRIKAELEMNPILEETLEDDYDLTQEQADDSPDDDNTSDSETENEEAKVDSDDEFDMEDFMNDTDLNNDRINRSSDDDSFQPVAPLRETLTEHLMKQLSMLDLDDNLRALAEVII
ncbi:MAG TPA: RNA polymerase sigma-54 factor, partial [Ignavibacteriales bacterium]|nr:RNA polymerase sigma-54 factor [Ignavibacteriales bacterium]